MAEYIEREKYIINEQELELLDKYEGTTVQRKDPYRYDAFSKEILAKFCRMKDRSNDMLFRRYQAARDVIDIIAKKVGIDPEKTCFWLYSPDADGTTPIIKRIDEWFSRSGEKAQLKRRLQELEQENTLLRSLIQK